MFPGALLLGRDRSATRRWLAVASLTLGTVAFAVGAGLRRIVS
ncbi:hypothetical protein ACFQPA_05785 [Halomarina halobia]|uniref:Uncharacterized protein n=1 Tax=Halomarina halobia TaxID=3033386 RepID=A0ABD6A5P8_9EURY|nr:hypothetical protein [Halomarina sp. PSR21]